ncbi:bacterioferritin [Uliginosibacterium sp. sgz301328]|uniref:ferritin-like domain-containing protein n=1 Tax=Uliginosibacterium sp. sgz301328 TaxID=3243764 RepID=UPI00359DF5AC
MNINAQVPLSNQRGDFVLDVETIRQRARDNMTDGAVTSSYGKDRDIAVRVLNQALATEIVCVLRYKRHAFMAQGPNSEPIAAEFHTHASEEQAHADQIAERIVQLGGEPDFSPIGLLDRSHSEYEPGKNLRDMLREDLIAERIAIDTYREMVRWFGDDDPTTRNMLVSILAKEEEHADDLKDLLSKE